MLKRRLCAPILICVGFSFLYGEPGVAAQGVSEPLYVKNLSPVSSTLGLPSQRQADTLASGTYSLALHSAVANYYVAEAGVIEQVNLDGETIRFALEARYGLAENWDIQLEVPWLSIGGGQLDSLIDNWHDLWGMADGGRSRIGKDILNVHYLDPFVRFSLVDDVSGIGDVSLSLSHAFFRGESSAMSAVVGYKFATGDEDKLLGSGGDDAFLALRFSGAHLADLPLRWHGQVGYLRAGSSDIFGARQEKNLWFAGVSLDWALTPSFSLLAQLDAHAAPLDSELATFGKDAVMGSLGARWSFAQHWAVDISFVEDLQLEAAPDITFQASVRYRGH